MDLAGRIVHHIVQFLVQFFVQSGIVVAAWGSVALLVSLILPSTRAALARWLHRRSGKELDQGDVMARLATANVRLAALQREVHALQSEVAVIQALNGGPKLGSLSPASTRGGVT
jgi:hypothetical protein